MTFGTLAGTAANVRLFGALGDNAVNNAAFANAMLAAKAARRPGAASGSSNPLGSYVIELPVGDFRITNPKDLLGNEAPGSNAWGLKIKGQGPGLTTIIFAPAAADALMFNDYWLGLRFEGIRFVAATPGCTFMQSYTTHAAQSYIFTDCDWTGWKYVFDLQGINNNSEFSFYGCANYRTETAGAFLFIGATNTSDQFLNYWFFGFKHQSTSAPLIDAAKGGHFHLYGVDCSDWGAALTGQGYLFNLRGNTHSDGVCSFTADAMRVEAKSTFGGLLYSEWPTGNVAFNAADFSSQAGGFLYGPIISVDVASDFGPAYTFRNSHLAGGVRVKFGPSAFTRPHLILFDSCTWKQKDTPVDVVTYDTSAAPASQAKPAVQFRDCLGTKVTTGPYNAAGMPTWDATVGYRGEMVHSLTPRVLSVRGNDGVMPTAGGTIYVRLPVGAIITGAEVLSPTGATTEADGGTYTITTTEVTPTTIATLTVTGAMSAGYDVKVDLAVPFECVAADQAVLKIVPTSVSTPNPRALLLIKGYW